MKEKRLSAGLVADRFPDLSSLIIHINHYDTRMVAPLFMERTINVSPESHAFFEIACPTGECNGSFNLMPVISDLIKKRKKTSNGKMQCIGDNTFPAGHAYITYKISINYKDSI